jgi:hypothetical protein
MTMANKNGKLVKLKRINLDLSPCWDPSESLLNCCKHILTIDQFILNTVHSSKSHENFEKPANRGNNLGYNTVET